MFVITLTYRKKSRALRSRKAKERHTAENITKWTKEALEAMGLTPEGLFAPDEE